MAKIRYFAALLMATVLCSVQSFTAKAQNPTSYYEEIPRVFYGGLLLGTNFTQVDGDSYAGYHKVGLNIGGIAYAQFAEHVAGSIEILFSQKGSHGHQEQYSNSKAYIIDKYDIKLNYAEVPLQINYFDKRKSHFGAGFSYSQLISSDETATTNPPVAGWSDTLARYPFKKSDINFIAGANLHLFAGLFLNLRFQYSVFSIRKSYYPEFGRADQYNNVWTLRLMYLFK
ncbi:porin family protein [Chitinophagaceae bacterium MMS25-I14]